MLDYALNATSEVNERRQSIETTGSLLQRLVLIYVVTCWYEDCQDRSKSCVGAQCMTGLGSYIFCHTGFSRATYDFVQARKAGLGNAVVAGPTKIYFVIRFSKNLRAFRSKLCESVSLFQTSYTQTHTLKKNGKKGNNGVFPRINSLFSIRSVQSA
jgi:hypothetical protein